MRRAWIVGSLAAHLVALAATWQWYDADEFVNLMQAVRANGGAPLYVETPSHHPPLYVELLLRPLVALPGSDLLAARLASVLLVWAAGLLLAELIGRQVDARRGELVLILWSLNAFILLAGSRAMNEVPVLALLVLSLWLAEGRSTVLAGAAGGLALTARLSAAFFLPAVATLRARRTPALILGGAAAIALAAGLYLLLHPGIGPALWADVVGFHVGREREDGLRRLGKALWWSGLPAILLIAGLRGRLRRPATTEEWTGLFVLVGGLLMVHLPTVHVHYYLAAAPLLVVVAAEAIHAAPRRGVRRLALALAVLLPLSQAVLYAMMVPQPDLQDAKDAAVWIRERTPEGRPILTDAPEYALLAGRDNYGGYFWSLKHTFGAPRFESALNGTSIVVVSPRFGHYDRGFPTEFLDHLTRFPCATVAGARIYWTDPGPTPNGFSDSCTN